MSGFGQVRCTIRAEDAGAFVNDLLNLGAGDAISRHAVRGNDASSLGETPVRDPRRFGVKGAYPRVGKHTSTTLLDRMDEEVGIFSALVDQWSQDTWSEGFTLNTADDAYREEVEALLYDLNVLEALEEADRFHIYQRDGYALLYWNLEDATGDPKVEPRSVRDALRVQVVPSSRVSNVRVNQDREDRQRFGQMEAVTIDLGNSQSQEVHHGRLTLVRENAILGEPVKGKSRAKPWLDSLLHLENVTWASAESFTQRAAPYLQATLHPDFKLTPQKADDIKESIDKLQNGIIQKILAEGFELKPVSGASSIVSPLPYVQVAQDAVAAVSRVPKHIIFGSAAGQLASATEDSRRYYGRVSRRQEHFGSRTVKAILDQWAAWGLTGEVPEDLTIVWKPLDEPTLEELMEAEERRGRTIQGYKAAGIRPPEKLVDYEPGELPLLEETTPAAPAQTPEPVEEEPPMTVLFEPDAAGVLRMHRTWAQHSRREALPPEARIENPDLKPVRLRGQTAIQGAMLDWQEQYLALFEADPRVDDVTPAREVSRSENQGSANVKPPGLEQLDPDDDLFQALMGTQLDAGPLAEVLLILSRDAALVGGRTMLRHLGRLSVADFLTETDFKTFRTLAGATGEAQRGRVTEAIRRSLADGLSSGESLQQLRRRVLDEFDVAVKNAERIARTEAMRGFNLGSRAALRATGQSRFEFQAFDAACPTCAPLDGKVFQLEDSGNLPPLHPNCRCQVTVVEADVLQ